MLNKRVKASIEVILRQNMKTGPSSEHFLGLGRLTAEATEGLLEVSSLGEHSRHPGE